MSLLRKTLYLLAMLIFLVLISSGCSPSRKNPYYQKRIQASKNNTQQLGRNRYYFSNGYQKKLTKSYKRR